MFQFQNLEFQSMCTVQQIMIQMWICMCYLFMFALIANQVSSSSFCCSSCVHQQFICAKDEPCLLNCTTSHSCENVTISCADNQDCAIYCDAKDSCQYMTVYGRSSSNLEIFASGTNAMHDATIICPENSSSNCVIICDRYSCINSYIEAVDTKTVSITARKDWAFKNTTINCTRAGGLNIGIVAIANGHNALSDAKIYCPNNGGYVSNGEGHSCVIDIYTVGEWTDGLNCEIYAVEGLNDFKLNVLGFNVNSDHGSNISNNVNGILYCMLNYSKSCYLGKKFTNSSNIECDDSKLDGSFCDSYLLPNDNVTQVTQYSPPIQMSSLSKRRLHQENSNFIVPTS